MSNRVGWATLQIIPSAKDFGANLRKETDPHMRAAGKQGGGQFGGAMVAGAARFVPQLALAFGAFKVGGIFKDAVAEASDLNEAANKLTTVFGTATGRVNAFAAAGAKGLGQSTLAIENAAATFGVYGKAAGLAGKANAKFATDLVGLSTDLASFYNTDPTDAVQAIAAGLRGESEPLRAYGVLLNEATLRQEALRLGLIKTTKKALTPQQRVLAAQQVILKQTAVAHGDFAKTAGGLANQQRILSAQWADAKGKLGQLFLPAVTRTVTMLNKGLGPAVEKVIPFLSRMSGAFSSVGKGAGPFAGQIAKVRGYVDSLRPTFKGIVSTLVDGGKFLGEFFRKNVVPILQWIGQKAAPLVGQLASTLKVGFEAALPALKFFVATGKGLLSFFGPTALVAVKAFFGGVIGILSGALTIIKGVFQVIKGLFTGDWSLLWKGVQNIFLGSWKIVLATLSGVWGILKGLFGGLVSWIGGKLADAAKAVGSWAFGVWKWFSDLQFKVIKTIIDMALGVRNWMRNLGLMARDAIVGRITAIVGAFLGLRDRVINTVKGLASSFVNIGRDVISGFIQGIVNNAGRIIGAIKSAITDKLPAFVKNALGIRSPSRVFMKLGGFVSQGMALGIRKKAGDVTKAVSALTRVPDLDGTTGTAASGGPGGRGPLVGALTVNATSEDSARDALEEALFVLRRINRGGVYA